MPDDGYESADLLPQAEATADAAIAAKPNMLRQWAIRLGLVKPTPLEIPILSPSEKMQLQLRQTFGAPTGFQRQAVTGVPMTWRSYAEPAQAPSSPEWNAVQAAAAHQEKVASELGGFSNAVMNSPLVTGKW